MVLQEAPGGSGPTGAWVDLSVEPGRVRVPAAGETDADAERARLAVLERYHLVSFAGAPSFDRLTRLAADLCGTSMALVSLVDADIQWYLSSFGVDPPPLHRSEGFCGHELARGETLQVTDARADRRFASHRVVTGPPSIRFYAGVPLVSPEGYVLGRLSVLDTEPGELTPRQNEQLHTLADEVMAQLTLRRQAAELAVEVAARRTSEAALARQERLLQGVLANPDVVTLARDLDGRFLMANDALHELLGQPKGSLAGRRYIDVLPASLVGEYVDGTRTFAVEADRTVTHVPFTHPDGRRLIFRVAKFPLRDADGAVSGMVLNGVDVTDQLAAAEALRASEARWHELFAGSPVGIGVLDADGAFREVNRALCALFDRAEDELLGHGPGEFSHPDDPAAPEFTHVGDAADDAVATVERRIVLPDGRVRWAWMTTAPTPGPGDEVWTLAHIQDVTERHAIQEAVRDSEANLTAVAEVIRTIQAGGDARQTVVDAGRSLADAYGAALLEPAKDGRRLVMTAATRPELVGMEVLLDGSSASGQAFISGDPVLVADPSSTAWLAPGIAGQLGQGSLCAIPVRSGDRVTAVLTVNWPVFVQGMDDSRIRAIALLADQAGVALRQVALVAELAQLAQTDALTGLPNRRSWDATLDSLLHTMSANGHPLSVALLDLDHFKVYNDTHGHAAGDVFLRDFAVHADSVLRTADTVARWGGEEFAVALPDCQAGTAAEVLERIRQGVPDGQTCSVGFGTWDGRESAADLMERVDAALYAAKRAGRDRIQLSPPPGRPSS